jgi:hypothetical protein
MDKPRRIPPDLSRHDRKALARTRIQLMCEHHGNFLRVLTEAVSEGDWQVLGYPSVAEWWASEVRQLLDMQTVSLRDLVSSLRQAGLTVRSAGEVLGISASTVSRAETGADPNKARKDRTRQPQPVSSQTLSPAETSHAVQQNAVVGSLIKQDSDAGHLAELEHVPYKNQVLVDGFAQPALCGHDAAWHEQAEQAIRIVGQLREVMTAGGSFTFPNGYRLTPLP